MNNKPNFVDNSKVYRYKLKPRVLTVVFFAVVVGLIFQTQNARFISTAKAASWVKAAGDLSVVGKPSLPATTIDAIFKSLGSPMNGTGQVVVQASQKANIDDAFALAVWWTETNDGAAGVGLADRNPGSVRGSVGYPSAYDGYTIYPSYSAAIIYWFNMLKNMYVNRGLSTVYLISHPYVGTSSSPLWAGKVVALMLKYRGEAPPAPIVAPHAKRVSEPTKYTHTTPISLEQQAQSRAGKTLNKRSSNIVRQANTTLSVPFSSITYVTVFFVLLLALAIVVCVFWLEKRLNQNLQNEDDLHTDALVTSVQVKDSDAPVTDALERPVKNMDVRKTGNPEIYTPIIPASQDMVAVPLDAAFPLNSGANFRIRRIVLLPSITGPEVANTGESPADSSLRGRSTGLLSRYGESTRE
jgi:hypothetical protein